MLSYLQHDVDIMLLQLQHDVDIMSSSHILLFIMSTSCRHHVDIMSTSCRHQLLFSCHVDIAGSCRHHCSMSTLCPHIAVMSTLFIDMGITSQEIFIRSTSNIMLTSCPSMSLIDMMSFVNMMFWCPKFSDMGNEIPKIQRHEATWCR